MKISLFVSHLEAPLGAKSWRAFCLGAASTLALSVPTCAKAQSTLPPVTVEAPQRLAHPAATQPSPNSSANRATRSNRAARVPQAAPIGPSSVMFGGSGSANKEGTAPWRLTGIVRDGGSQVDFVRDNRVFIAPAVTFKPDEDTTLTLLQHGRLLLCRCPQGGCQADLSLVSLEPP